MALDVSIDDSTAEGTRALLRRTWATAGAWVVGGAGLVLAAYGVLAARPVGEATSSRASIAAAELLAFGFGAVAALAASQLALSLGGKSSGANNGTVAASLRASSAPAIASAAVSTLAFGASLVVASSLASGVDRSARIAFAVAAHAFGASLGAALTHVGGGAFSVGAEEGAKERARVDPDERNPAVVLARVARRFAERTAHGAEIAELSAIDLVAATILTATATLDGRGDLAPLVFPVVARAFGLVAAFAGVMAVKSTEGEPSIDAIDRGSSVAAGLSAIGLVAAAWWLLRGAFVGVACAGVLGVAAAWGLVRFGRDARGAMASSAPTFVALALVPASWACGHLGAHSLAGQSGRGGLALAVASVGFLCASAFPLAASTLPLEGAMGEGTAGEAASSMRTGVARLVQAATVIVAWVGVLAFVAAARHSVTQVAQVARASDLTVLAPVAGVACAVGAVVAVAAAVLARRAASRVAQATEEEIARVLADVPTEEGRAVFPIDFHPAHDLAVGHVASDAQLHAATSILLAVGTPIVVGLVARRGFGLGVESVVALVFGATLVPLLFAPLSRVLGQEQPAAVGAVATPWLAFTARSAVAVALALAVIFSG